MNNLNYVVTGRGFFISIAVLAGLFTLPIITEAAVDDPSTYHISSYDYFPSLGVAFLNDIPTIHHLDTVSISYGKDSNMDIVLPDGVSSAIADLYFVPTSSSREFEYRFYDDSRYTPPAPYIWTKSGNYEVDIYGIVPNTVGRIYLATMTFNVLIDGGPAPTCVITVTPNTVFPKQGESAFLEWSSVNATTAIIDQGIGSVATSGSLEVEPIATTTYTINFTGTYGLVSCSATVNVPDPIIVPLHEKAANLARQLVNQSEAYLWGGKGWDFDLGEFTTPERILSGYTYINPDTGSEDSGVGLDCSGLITWAFNRSNDATAGFNDNYIKYVNADGMYKDYQSSPVNEAELQPGDILSYDWNNDGYIDHVAMYVGDSGSYDVVNARSRDFGIETQTVNLYKNIPGFVGFRRIHQADVALSISTGSPVNLEITDPDGNVVSASSILTSEEEYIREIPDKLYYLELEQGHDGRPKDIVLAPSIKDGTYRIKVVPESDAAPTETYSLAIELNGVETIVVENETIDSIPENGFALKLANGEIQSLDPTMKVLLEDLYQIVSEQSISSDSRKRNLLSTIESALSWFERNRTDQIVRKLTKLQNDINRHIARELTEAELIAINQQIQNLLLLLSV